MPRNRNIYQVQAVYVGPAPSTGYHFLSGAGTLNNAYTDLGNNNNLIKHIPRVQNASWGFNIDYQRISELGKRGLVSEEIINNPTVNMSFSYLNHGVINDLRLGFLENYETSSGPFYQNNYGTFLLSGFVTREMIQPASSPYWPLSYRDRRNIFMVFTEEGKDVARQTYYKTDPDAANFNVFGFGDCYINSYSTRGAVGTFPTTTVSYVCENIQVSQSGSGVNIPAVNKQSGLPITDKNFSIPSTYEGLGNVSVLLPGDMNLSFQSAPKMTGILAMYGTGYAGSLTSNIVDIGVKFSDIKVQSYELNIPLERQPLYSLGFKNAVDRRIVFPLVATLGVNCFYGDLETGNLAYLRKNNVDYNVSLVIDNPPNADVQGVAFQYDLRRAKLNSVNYSSDIGPPATVSLLFSVELEPEDLTKGLFISGALNTLSEEGFLAINDSDDLFKINNVDNSLIKWRDYTTILY